MIGRRWLLVGAIPLLLTACHAMPEFMRPAPEQRISAPDTLDGLAGSDHYGVLNTYSYRRTRC